MSMVLPSKPLLQVHLPQLSHQQSLWSSLPQSNRLGSGGFSLIPATQSSASSNHGQGKVKVRAKMKVKVMMKVKAKAKVKVMMKVKVKW